MTEDVSAKKFSPTSFVKIFKEAALDMSGREVNKVRNSIGSNVFFGFGEDIPIILPNKKTHHRRKWMIWLGFSEWRITCHDRHVVGSCDESAVITEKIPILLGKRFQSFDILSEFMDIQINFDHGYKITTFICLSEEEQWTLFLPKEDPWISLEPEGAVYIDFDTEEQRQRAKYLSQFFEIYNPYKRVETPIDGLEIRKIRYNDDGFFISFRNHVNRFLLIIDMWSWRLIKSNENLFGPCDEDADTLRKLEVLVGKKIQQIEVANSMSDTRFVIDDEYVLETFACSADVMNEWGIYTDQPDPIFVATPPTD